MNYKNKMLKAGIYDPYMDSLGGGERYCLTVAETLLKNGYEVDLFWSGDKEIIAKAKERFNLDIERLNIVDDPFNLAPNKIEYIENTESITKVVSHRARSLSLPSKIKQFIDKIKITRNYDLIFYISDWSIPFLFSKNNLLHVQVPLKTTVPLSVKLINFLKLLFIRKIICNSEFTLKIATDFFGPKCTILYPPVDADKFENSDIKQNIIISVGRFDDILNIKKQDVMIEAFKKLHHQNPKTDWKLILAGASLESEDKNSYLSHLRAKSQGLPIEFHINPKFADLKKLYSTSKIYWHAAGFEVDEYIHPEHTEHFGMTPVEAMASGCVPIVVAKGGLPEIVDDGVNGYLWNNIDTLVAKTQLLMGNEQIRSEMSLKTATSSKRFSKEVFVTDFIKHLNHV